MDGSRRRDTGDDGSNGDDDTNGDEDWPKEPPARPSLRVFVKVLLHRGERIEPRDARIPPPVVLDSDPGRSFQDGHKKIKHTYVARTCSDPPVVNA